MSQRPAGCCRPSRDGEALGQRLRLAEPRRGVEEPQDAQQERGWRRSSAWGGSYRPGRYHGADARPRCLAPPGAPEPRASPWRSRPSPRSPAVPRRRPARRPSRGARGRPGARSTPPTPAGRPSGRSGTWAGSRLRSADPRFGGPLRPAGQPRRRAARRRVGLRERPHGRADVRRGRPSRGPCRRAARRRSAPAGTPAWTRVDAESLVAAAGGPRGGFRGAGRAAGLRRPSRPFAGPVRPLPSPPGLGECGRNGGLETMTATADGAPPARLRGAAGRVGHGAGVGRARRRRGRRASTRSTSTGAGRGSRSGPTGATRLPDGDLLVVERRFPPIGARIVRLSRASLGGVRAARAVARSPGSRRPLTRRQLRGGGGAP